MRFYRRLTPFKAISFDLDDTLYHNQPVMQATDTSMARYFSELLSSTDNFDYTFWFNYRSQVLAAQPELVHDVAELRRVSYQLGLQALGFSSSEAKIQAQQALAYFVEQRSNFTVPDNVHQLLNALSERWPLMAISNGNVDTQAIGIAKYFSDIFHAGNGLRQKPHADMYQLACQQRAIAAKDLLHVGDCGRADIQGAMAMGCQTAWLSCYQVGKPLSILPHLELSDVVDLNILL